MSNPNARSLYLPQASIWLLRLASDPYLVDKLAEDAMAFAAWYAQIGEVLEWPEAVRSIQTAERARKLSLDRMMKLLSQVNYAYAGRTSATHARGVLEGYAVHEWARSHSEELEGLASEQLSRLTVLQEAASQIDSDLFAFSRRLKQLGKVLAFSELESDILAFAVLSTASEEIAGLFRALASDRFVQHRLWTVVFKTTREALAKALQPKSPLRLCGLLRPGDRSTHGVRVSQFWIDLLADSNQLFDALLEPYDRNASSGMPARLLEEDQALAVKILSSDTEPGVNLLLYGAGSLEKGRIVREIVTAAHRQAYRVRPFEDTGRYEHPSLTYLAFKLLSAEPGRVLVIERPSEVLETTPSDFMRSLFGIELDTERTSDFDAHLLTTNPVPGLWLASNAAALPEGTVAQFVFHAPLKKADKATQRVVLLERMKGLELSDESVSEILKLEGVSAAQLESALRAARLAGQDTPAAREMAIVQAVRRSQRALSRDLQPKTKESVTTYSLKHLNTSGKFRPEQILECFKRRPKGTVLLYGGPGTGKTQFVEYLAQALGRPLLAKSASELISKWVGDTEKNIAAAFEEAANEEAILFLDEGDSFLRRRSAAEHSWEVTQVNELLQKMERFNGIVVVATNLFKGLDAAAIRRFTFKLHFRELDLQGRWDMFVTEAKIDPATVPAHTRERWENELTLMPALAAGDFATVKRQCLALDLVLTPEEWLEQLRMECALKQADPHD